MQKLTPQMDVQTLRFRITYTSRKRVFHTEEKRSEIIEAPDLEEAQAKAKIKLGSNYPIDWTVSVEQIAETNTR